MQRPKWALLGNYYVLSDRSRLVQTAEDQKQSENYFESSKMLYSDVRRLLRNQYAKRKGPAGRGASEEKASVLIALLNDHCDN